MITGRPFRRHGTVSVVIILALFAAITRPAFAQITSATISGTVKDQTNAVLPGVDVVVKNVSTGLTRTGVTDANGYFTLPGLPPGTYETRASLTGFGTAVERVTLAVAQEAGLTLTLAVTGTAESITVVGTAALVDTRSAAMSAVVTEKTISELPLNGRNYIDLALLQPGVSNFSEKDSTSSSNRGTKLNINGMSFRSNSYLLDGANMRGYAGTATVSAAETTLGGIERLQEDLGVTTTTFVPNDAARSGGFAPISTAAAPYLNLFPRANGPDVGVGTGIGVFSYELNQPTRENFYQGRMDFTISDK